MSTNRGRQRMRRRQTICAKSMKKYIKCVQTYIRLQPVCAPLCHRFMTVNTLKDLPNHWRHEEEEEAKQTFTQTRSVPLRYLCSFVFTFFIATFFFIRMYIVLSPVVKITCDLFIDLKKTTWVCLEDLFLTFQSRYIIRGMAARK